MIAALNENGIQSRIKWAIARDELAGWFSSFDRYRQSLGTDVARWLELHRAGTLIVDRKSGEPKHIFVPRAAASITGTIQPGVLHRTLTPQFFENGLAARFLLTMPPRHPKRWNDVQLAQDLEQRVGEVLDRLIEVDGDWVFGDDEEPDLVPIEHRLTDEAKLLWVAFYNEHGEIQQSATGREAALLAKIEELPARLALIFAAVRKATTDVGVKEWFEVDESDMVAAIRLSRWLLSETLRVYRIVDETDVHRQHRELIDFMRARV